MIDKKIQNRRLIEIYKDAYKIFYNDMSNISQKSKHWKRYDAREFNLENLINFRSNDGLSSGIETPNDTFSFKLFAEIINELSEDYVLRNLPKENIGNSDLLIKYKNVYLDYNKLILILWFHKIENLVLNKSKILNICEIGGGWGSFAELFIINYNTKLVSIDLPEANLMTAYYLKENFPNKKFYLYDDYKKNNIFTYNDLISNDIIILPPNTNFDPKIKIDFFINARSMMEMNFVVIKSYFDFIHKHCHENSYFLNINRYQKDSVGEKIRISGYPYDRNWKVIISEPSFNQDWIHFLITQRNSNKSEQNIENELDKIKNLGKKFYIKSNNYSSSFVKTKIVLRKLLKFIFGIKILNFLGKILFVIGTKLKNIQ